MWSRSPRAWRTSCRTRPCGRSTSIWPRGSCTHDRCRPSGCSTRCGRSRRATACAWLLEMEAEVRQRADLGGQLGGAVPVRRAHDGLEPGARRHDVVEHAVTLEEALVPVLEAHPDGQAGGGLEVAAGLDGGELGEGPMQLR